MSTRERWIVYPLLFLTLGIAMRNQFLPTRRTAALDFSAGEIRAQRIICENLEVYRSEKCEGLLEFDRARGNGIETGSSQTIHLKAKEAECQKFAVTDEQDKPVVWMQEDKNTKTGLIRTMSSGGVPQTQLSSIATGGVVSSFGRGHLGQIAVLMGYIGQDFGVFAQMPQLGQPLLLTTRPFQTKPTPTTSKTIPSTNLQSSDAPSEKK